MAIFYYESGMNREINNETERYTKDIYLDITWVIKSILYQTANHKI